MKLFGKRGANATANAGPGSDPGNAFGAAPLPRHAGPPASSTPLADELARSAPGVTRDYVVLPRSIAEQMPLAWQRQLAGLLAQFHQTHQQLNWPRYRVLPSREEKLVDLDEEQLAEAGYRVEMDADGELVYSHRTGRKVTEPEQETVLVTCLDPIVAARPPDVPAQSSQRRAPAPINVGPQPDWSVPGRDAHTVRPPTSRQPRNQAELDTPPRGLAVPTREQRATSAHSGAAQAGPADWFGEVDTSANLPDFGPTGEPIERPYRSRD